MSDSDKQDSQNKRVAQSDEENRNDGTVESSQWNKFVLWQSVPWDWQQLSKKRVVASINEWAL